MASQPVPTDTDDPILTTAEVARLFRTSSRNVTVWAREGKLPHFRTPSGRLRFRGSDITPMLGTTGSRVSPESAA